MLLHDLPPWDTAYQQSHRRLTAGVFEAMCRSCTRYCGWPRSATRRPQRSSWIATPHVQGGGVSRSAFGPVIAPGYHLVNPPRIPDAPIIRLAPMNLPARGMVHGAALRAGCSSHTGLRAAGCWIQMASLWSPGQSLRACPQRGPRPRGARRGESGPRPGGPRPSADGRAVSALAGS